MLTGGSKNILPNLAKLLLYQVQVRLVLQMNLGTVSPATFFKVADEPSVSRLNSDSAISRL